MEFTVLNPGSPQVFTLGDDESMHLFLPILEGSSETNLRVELKGDRSRVVTHIVFFGSGTEKQKVRVEHVHLGRETVSELFSKGAVTDEAVSSFYGTVQMEPGSNGAKGHLEEHNLLLSPTAKIDAVPALEIHHDDVQASHAATLEKVDAERLFYLQARGLSQAEAVELIVEGFFKAAFEPLPDELREKLYTQILSKLS